MMKKKYQQPQTNVIKVSACRLLAGSLPNNINNPSISSSRFYDDDEYDDEN